MTNTQIESFMYECAGHLNIKGLESHHISKFINYIDLLLEWNGKFNLTAITDKQDIIVKHFFDSLSLFLCEGFPESPPAGSGKNYKIIDVGTGAGFPGIPLKILYPPMNVLLLDSLNKRVNFLNAVIGSLGLENISAAHMRAEDAGRDNLYRQRYDYCVSRAVARLNILLEYCMPFVKTGGYFYAMKGPDVAEELNGAKVAIKTLGGELLGVKQVILPFSGAGRTIIVVKKVRHTGLKYPRIASSISKNPIE